MLHGKIDNVGPKSAVLQAQIDLNILLFFDFKGFYPHFCISQRDAIERKPFLIEFRWVENSISLFTVLWFMVVQEDLKRALSRTVTAI